MRPPAPPRRPRREPVTVPPPADRHHDRRPAQAGSGSGAGAGSGARRRADAPASGSTIAASDDRQPAARTVLPATGDDARAGSRRWPARRRGEHDPALVVARPGFAERLAEQVRARRRLAWRKVLAVLGVLVVLGAAGWLVLISPVLALDVEEVAVAGAGEGTTVSRAEVMAVVAEEAGTPLARLDTDGLADEVEAITTVRSAQVVRSWPTGLSVDVAARVPVAAVRDGDGVALLDAEGVVVGSAAEPPEDMPSLSVPLSGERAGETLQAVLTVLAALPDALRAEVATAGASSPASITLELGDGAEVRWGGVGESALKAAVLEVLREREASRYDVTVPRAPTISDPVAAKDPAAQDPVAENPAVNDQAV